MSDNLVATEAETQREPEIRWMREEGTQMTGKEDLGQDHLRNAALKALENNVSLPIVLERT